MASLAVLSSALVGAGFDVISNVKPVILAMIVTYFFVAAGNSLNDYMDRETDKIAHPDRPIPSRRLKAEYVPVISCGLFGFVIILSWFINIYCFYVVLGAFLLQISYELILKRGFLGNVAISAQTALAFLFGGFAIREPIICGILAGLAFLAILSREIVKDIADLEGDFNRETLPKAIGIRNANVFASAFILSAIVLSPLPYFADLLHPSYMPIVIIANAIFIYSIIIQCKNPGFAVKTMKLAMIIVLSSFLVGGLL